MPPTEQQLIAAIMQANAGCSVGLATEVAAGHRADRRLGAALQTVLNSIAAKIGCAVSELRCDHDPMLRVRTYKPKKGKPVADWYTPHAHDPAHLRFRAEGAQFDGSHYVKTYLRGDHGQYSDVVLAKRERRLEKKQRGDRPKSKGWPAKSRIKHSGIRSAQRLTSCRLGARCACQRRERKACENWRTQKIGGRW